MTMGIVVALIILVLGAFTVGVSLSFLVKPTEVKLGFIRPLSIATTYASIVGVVSGLAVALTQFSQQLRGSKDPAAAVFLGGISEALVPSIIGFSLLTIAWIAVSLGMRKHI